jgi:hypothetical protein
VPYKCTYLTKKKRKKKRIVGTQTSLKLKNKQISGKTYLATFIPLKISFPMVINMWIYLFWKKIIIFFLSTRKMWYWPWQYKKRCEVELFFFIRMLFLSQMTNHIMCHKLYLHISVLCSPLLSSKLESADIAYGT